MPKIAYLVLWGVILSLLGYTAARTLDFLSLSFGPTQQVMPWLGLAAFDGGSLGWYIFFKYSARGWQRGFSFLMVFVCLSGVCICTYADTFMVASHNGLVTLPIGIANNALVGTVVIILVNVVMCFITHMVHPEAIRQWKVESAHDKIEDMTLKAIDQGSTLIAGDISSQLGQQWQAQAYRNLGLDVPENLPQIEPPKKKAGLLERGIEAVKERTNRSSTD